MGAITSYGNLTIDPGTTANRTYLQGTGSAFNFDGGSLTHIGTPATAPTEANGHAIYDIVDLDGANDLVGANFPVLNPVTRCPSSSARRETRLPLVAWIE